MLDDEKERLRVLGNLGGGSCQHLVLVLLVVAACEEHVVKDCVRVEAKPFRGHFTDALDPKCSLGVKHEHPPRRSTVRGVELSSDGEGGGELGLAAAELTEISVTLWTVLWTELTST